MAALSSVSVIISRSALLALNITRNGVSTEETTRVTLLRFKRYFRAVVVRNFKGVAFPRAAA
jgi:hypothetical protein